MKRLEKISKQIIDRLGSIVFICITFSIVICSYYISDKIALQKKINLNDIFALFGNVSGTISAFQLLFITSFNYNDLGKLSGANALTVAAGLFALLAYTLNNTSEMLFNYSFL